MTRVHIEFYAILRERSGKDRDTVETQAKNMTELYQQIKRQYDLPLAQGQLRVAKNDAFCSWDSTFIENDTVIFIPPVAGG